MPKSVPTTLHTRPFTRREALTAGITRRELQGKRFRRVFYGVYVCAGVPDSVAIRADAAATLLPSSAVFRGLTSAALLDIPVPDPPLIEAVVPPGDRRARTAGLRVTEHALTPELFMTVHGRQLLVPELIFIDAAPRLQTEDLIVAGDALLNRGWTSLDLLASATHSHHWPGVVAARDALPHLEPRAASPGETRSRLALMQLGFPRPRAGIVILDENGGWIAEVDMLIDDPPVVFQYDGEVHFASAQKRRSDAARDEGVRDLDWEVVILTKLDLRDRHRLDRRARAACERAAGRVPRGFTRQGRLPTLRAQAS